MAIKSVHITNYYHKDSGGISTAYNKLLEAANRRKRFVRLIVPSEETTVEEVGDYGRIYYIKANHSPIIDRRYRLMMPWKTYMPDGSPIKTILRREKPDIIEIGEKYTLSLMAGLLRRRAMNVTPSRPILVHSSCERMDDNVRSFIGDGRITSWLTRLYMGNYAIPMFDFHLTNSDYTRQELVDSVSKDKNPHRSDSFFELCSDFWRTPKVEFDKRIFVNQCGVDIDLFSARRKSAERRQSILRECNLPEDSLILLYAGRVSPEKNVDMLPRTMKILRERDGRDFRLLVAGDGPSTASLATASEKLAPGSVKILGQIGDKNKLADLFANCDAFVHPNPHEPFGITPLEAMASGLPVVAPNAGGVLSYADQENAWLAEPNPLLFAAAIRKVFDDEDGRRKKIDAGIATSERYSWKDSTDALFAIYDKIHTLFHADRTLYDYAKAPGGIDYSK